MYVRTYVMYVRTYVRTYVRMYVCMYVCMYAHHTDIHAPHLKASVATQPSFRHHSFGRVLHKLWLALLPATQASLSLHCAELSHRHLLSTHNASEPCPFALPQGLGVIAQRHRRPFAHCPPSTQASQPSKPVPSPSTALSEPTGACSRFRRTPSPARRIAKGAWRDCAMPRTAFRRPLPLHCTGLTHRRLLLLSTHAKPFPSHCQRGLA